jgi:hypothetical protein
MSATELQSCLAHLYTSAAARRLLRVAPDEVLDGYFLSAAERDAIMTIDSNTLDYFASSLKTKRRDRLERAYPALFTIVQPVLETYYDRYHELYPLRPEGTNNSDTIQFGIFMEETLTGDEELPDYVANLVRFERTLLQLRQSLRADHGASQADEPGDSRGFDGWPRRCRGVTVARFDCNVSEIDEALRDGREPDVRDESEFIVYALRDGERDPRILRVSEATALVVDLCDGEHSISDIVAAVEQHYEQSGLGGGIADVIGQLSDAKILDVADEVAV